MLHVYPQPIPRSGRRTLWGLLFLLLWVSPPAWGQETGDAPADPPEAASDEIPAQEEDALAEAPATGMSSGIEEMVVKGSTRDELLKDLAVSVTSFNAAEVKSLRIQNIADLSAYTPNLEINTAFAASNPTLFIRGIGLKDYNANAAGAVAVYQDGININSPAIQLGQIFDIQSIEVLRGPQGSLNGRNASAGAIMLNSVLPDGEFDISGSFSYGNLEYYAAEGALSLPLVDDLLSARFAFTANFRNGSVQNQCANWDPERVGSPPLTEENVRASWEALGRPIENARGTRDIFTYPDGLQNRIRRPDGTIQSADEDALGRQLTGDSVCIHTNSGDQFLDLEPLHADPTLEPLWNSKRDGYTDSNGDFVFDPSVRILDDFQGLQDKVNDIDNWAGRGTLRFTPDRFGEMDWILNFHGGQNRSDSQHLDMLRAKFLLGDGSNNIIIESFDEPFNPSSAAQRSGFEGTQKFDGFFTSDSTVDDKEEGGLGGNDPDSGYYDSDGEERLDTWGANLRGQWDVGPVVLRSITGYEWYERTVDDEGDATPLFTARAFYEDTAWQVSQETRIEGEGERYRWSTGLFFIREDLTSSNEFPGILSRSTSQSFDQTLTSLAPYASGRLWLLDEVSLDAGVRYNWEHKDFALESSIDNVGSGVSVGQFDDEIQRTWTGVTGDVTLAYQPNRDWMYNARLDSLNLYAKYARGMKGGHFNAGLTIQGDLVDKQRITPVEPEFIHSVELGFKSRWFEDRLIVNFAAFRYWYEDLQVFDIINENGELPIQQLLNSDADVLGAELEIQARPIDGLMFQFGGGYIDSEFLDFTVEKAVLEQRGQGALSVFDYSGNPLIAAPEWNFSGVVEYQIPLGRWGSLVPQYDFSFRSKVYLDPARLDPISQDGYWLHNARLAYRTPDGRIEIAGWVENFLDERALIDVFDQSIQQQSVLQVWNDPRLYGLTVSFYW